MIQETYKNVESNALEHTLKAGSPRTRAYIKQETEDSKESLRCSLYSPVTVEPFLLGICKDENYRPTKKAPRKC